MSETIKPCAECKEAFKRMIWRYECTRCLGIIHRRCINRHRCCGSNKMYSFSPVLKNEGRQA